jgi:drug/metabolite transporter (DMT)-like permease
LTLCASMLFAVQVLLLDRLGHDVPAGHLTVGFFAATGLLALLLAVGSAVAGPGIGRWLRWTADNLRTPSLALDVGLLTVFCTVLAFHWMNMYQPQVSASRAALIYLLEPVFAAAFSVAWGYDQLNARLLLGGGIILGGNLLVDLPRMRNEWVQYRLRRSQLDLDLEQEAEEKRGRQL